MARSGHWFTHCLHSFYQMNFSVFHESIKENCAGWVKRNGWQPITHHHSLFDSLIRKPNNSCDGAPRPFVSWIHVIELIASWLSAITHSIKSINSITNQTKAATIRSVVDWRISDGWIKTNPHSMLPLPHHYFHQLISSIKWKWMIAFTHALN